MWRALILAGLLAWALAGARIGYAIGAAEVRQGEVIVGFPHKPAITARQYPLATCTSPILRFTPGGPAVLGTTEASKGASGSKAAPAGRASTTDRSAVAVPVDPSLITAAINRPRGADPLNEQAG